MIQELKKKILLWFINNHKSNAGLPSAPATPICCFCSIMEELAGESQTFCYSQGLSEAIYMNNLLPPEFQCLLPSLVVLAQAYHDPMLKLSIMTEQELNQIFGTLDSLIPLHEGIISFPGWVVTCSLNWAALYKSWLCNNMSNPEPTSSLLRVWVPNDISVSVCLPELLSQLRDVRKPDGSTEHVGAILVGWVRKVLWSWLKINVNHWNGVSY